MRSPVLAGHGSYSRTVVVDIIGKHVGTAFMEMQFYPPGWVSWPAGNSCDATQWCAALNIDSLNEDQNSGTVNNTDCLNRVGVEPVSFAFITKSGAPHASPAPLDVFTPPYPALTPNPSTDLFMNSGDTITVDMHDTPAGFQVVIHDLTTGQSGSMTASTTNGFKQVLYEPTSGTCHQAPYAYHPMYSTSSEHTRVPWAAHTYNVAFSDEIGHFEYCNAADANGNCTAPVRRMPRARRRRRRLLQRRRLDARPDRRVASPRTPTSTGPPYGLNWPGTGKNNGQDEKYHPTPITFTSPLFNGNQNYSRVAFETDLPRIEAPDSGGICNRFTGENCVNPPPGAAFYPIYTTGTSTGKGTRGANGHCVWQLGGPASRERRTRSAGTRPPSTGRCSSASTPARTRRPGCERTTSATSSTPIPAPPSGHHARSALRGAPRPLSGAVRDDDRPRVRPVHTAGLQRQAVDAERPGRDLHQ